MAIRKECAGMWENENHWSELIEFHSPSEWWIPIQKLNYIRNDAINFLLKKNNCWRASATVEANAAGRTKTIIKLSTFNEIAFTFACSMHTRTHDVKNANEIADEKWRWKRAISINRFSILYKLHGEIETLNFVWLNANLLPMDSQFQLIARVRTHTGPPP